MLCKCGSSLNYNDCCGQYHLNASLAQSAEVLMRSRYCAYALHNADYIYETTLPKKRNELRKADILEWATKNKWIGLEIVHSTEKTVEFKAHFLDEKMNTSQHHEKSNFKKVDGKWFYVDGIYP